MLPYIKKIEFVISPQYSYPNNCSVISFNGQTGIHFIRNVKESSAVKAFFRFLGVLEFARFYSKQRKELMYVLCSMRRALGRRSCPLPLCNRQVIPIGNTNIQQASKLFRIDFRKRCRHARLTFLVS